MRKEVVDMLHRSDDPVCLDGCAQCDEFRVAVEWPSGVALRRNATMIGDKGIRKACETFELTWEIPARGAVGRTEGQRADQHLSCWVCDCGCLL